MSGKLMAWLTLVGVLITLEYSARAAAGKPDRDVLYHWSTAISAVFQYAIMLGIVLAIAGEDRGRLLALRRPTSWKRGLKIAFGLLVGIYLLGLALEPLHPDREQGLTPLHWEPKHAAAYVVNGLVFAGVAPIVEELTFRGVGYGLLERYGRAVAILAVGVLFGLSHGLVEALPVLAAFGIGLAYLRSRTGSVYPGMLLHACFNAIALTVAVA